jgi:hypothetical protein
VFFARIDLLVNILTLAAQFFEDKYKAKSFIDTVATGPAIKRAPGRMPV